MWLSYKTIVYKHFPAKFLRRKRNEKLRQKKKMQQTFCLCFTSNIQLLHTKQRWPANCCLKTEGKQWHPGSSISSNFPGAVLYFQFNNIWKKKSISLFFLASYFFFFWLNFFNNLDLKKTIIKKCLKQIVG